MEIVYVHRKNATYASLPCPNLCKNQCSQVSFFTESRNLKRKNRKDDQARIGVHLDHSRFPLSNFVSEMYSSKNRILDDIMGMCEDDRQRYDNAMQIADGKRKAKKKEKLQQTI